MQNRGRRLSYHSKELGPNKDRMDISNCIIVPLEKRDTNSDPKSVIALLEDVKGKFLTGVERAIQQAKLFETNIYGLLENVGTNLGILFKMLRNQKDNMWE